MRYSLTMHWVPLSRVHSDHGGKHPSVPNIPLAKLLELVHDAKAAEVALQEDPVLNPVCPGRAVRDGLEHGTACYQTCSNAIPDMEKTNPHLIFRQRAAGSVKAGHLSKQNTRLLISPCNITKYHWCLYSLSVWLQALIFHLNEEKNRRVGKQQQQQQQQRSSSNRNAVSSHCLGQRTASSKHATTTPPEHVNSSPFMMRESMTCKKKRRVQRTEMTATVWFKTQDFSGLKESIQSSNTNTEAPIYLTASRCAVVQSVGFDLCPKQELPPHLEIRSTGPSMNSGRRCAWRSEGSSLRGWSRSICRFSWFRSSIQKEPSRSSVVHYHSVDESGRASLPASGAKSPTRVGLPNSA